MSSTVGRHPKGAWAIRRVTVSHGEPWHPHRRHHGSGVVTSQRISAFASPEVLADGGQPQVVEAGESREVRRGEGRLVHCRGLSMMVSVVTSILRENLDFFRFSTCPGSGVLGSAGYTLISEEPQNCAKLPSDQRSW